ncbi:MAG TPA: hypothetical protein VJ942_03935 [Roseovarius sp.]|nr:hypothetical protein [Roseovarius sp.]
MTEITGNNRSPFWPKPTHPGHVIDPVAFVLALLGGPLLVTVATFWAFVPIFALVFGAPAYLICGTPTLLWYLSRYEARPIAIGLLAVAVNTATLPVLLWTDILPGRQDVNDMLFMFGGFGGGFAFLWGAAFGWLYPQFRRGFFAPITPNAIPERKGD